MYFIFQDTPQMKKNTLQIENCDEDLRLQCGSESDVKDGVITSHRLD